MTKRIEKMNIELAGNYADELKTLVSSLCEDIKDSESVTDAWNKIDRFYKDAESMRNKQKCTGRMRIGSAHIQRRAGSMF